jgi:hypothetical protein
VFEVGKYYRVKMWEPGHKGGTITESLAAQVVEVALPLVKFKASAIGGGGETIVNMASQAFVSAQEAT